MRPEMASVNRLFLTGQPVFPREILAGCRPVAWPSSPRHFGIGLVERLFRFTRLVASTNSAAHRGGWCRQSRSGRVARPEALRRAWRAAKHHTLRKASDRAPSAGQVVSAWVTLNGSRSRGKREKEKERGPLIGRLEETKRPDPFSASPGDATKALESDAELANLCYALNGYKGIHGWEYTQAVYRRLEAAFELGGAAKVRQALKDMAKILEDGGTFW